MKNVKPDEKSDRFVATFIFNFLLFFLYRQEVAGLIPAIVASTLKPEHWLEMVNEHFILVRHFTAMNARIKFLGKLLFNLM